MKGKPGNPGTAPKPYENSHGTVFARELEVRAHSSQGPRGMSKNMYKSNGEIEAAKRV